MFSLTDTKRFYLFIITFFAGCQAWLLYNLSLAGNEGISLCWFKNLTGLPCPACGTTRSVEAILHGHPQAGLNQNPAGFIAVILLIAVPLWLVIDLIRKDASLRRAYIRFDRVMKQKPLLAFLVFSLVAANWALLIFKHL